MNELFSLYEQLLKHYGKQNWWPADNREEVIIGAILTQNTNWSNVIRALDNLKQENLCTLNKLSQQPAETIAPLIKSAGYYNVKAARLKNIAEQLKDWSPENLPIQEARAFLLNIKGIGNETADSILLYAYQIPVFVIDAYTVRLLGRVKRVPTDNRYEYYQNYFMDGLPLDHSLYNEYHALIVKHCKAFCRVKPICRDCPLNKSCISKILE
jgi:endonuclease-3 related protein